MWGLLEKCFGQPRKGRIEHGELRCNQETGGGSSNRKERKGRMKLKVATRSEMSKIQIGGWKAALITHSFSVSIPFVKLGSDHR